MVTQSSQTPTNAPERHSAHVIHYNLSYIVQGAEHGTDGAFVLLHDILGGAFIWEGILSQLATTGRAVYAIDMLGYGESDHPWPSDTSIWGQADCISFLLNHLNLTNIILVGFGVGGGVAQVLATRLAPGRVAALVLINSIAYEYTYAPNWPLPEMHKQQDPDAPKHISVEDMLKQLRETMPNATQYPDKLQDSMNQYMDEWNSHLGKEMLFQHIRLLLPNYSNSVSSDLRVMGKPALIIWSEKDMQFPLKLAQRLHREIPESRLVIVPDAGHMILFDAPDQVASALVDFMGNL